MKERYLTGDVDVPRRRVRERLKQLGLWNDVRRKRKWFEKLQEDYFGTVDIYSSEILDSAIEECFGKRRG